MRGCIIAQQVFVKKDSADMAAQSVERKPSATDGTYQVIDLIGGPRRRDDDISIGGDSIGSASPLGP